MCYSSRRHTHTHRDKTYTGDIKCMFYVLCFEAFSHIFLSLFHSVLLSSVMKTSDLFIFSFLRNAHFREFGFGRRKGCVYCMCVDDVVLLLYIILPQFKHRCDESTHTHSSTQSLPSVCIPYVWNE